MNGYDIQSALEIAKRLEGIRRRAKTFEKSKDDVLLEIEFMIEDYFALAERIEKNMEAFHDAK